MNFVERERVKLVNSRATDERVDIMKDIMEKFCDSCRRIFFRVRKNWFDFKASLCA